MNVAAEPPSPSGATAAPERFTPAYRGVVALTGPIVGCWGRMEVAGLEALPKSGPVLIMGNHDSYWDPIAVGAAARSHRQIRALAKSTMFTKPVVGRVLTAMGQIQIERGKGDARALDTAISELAGGACIGVFPEGTISRGTVLRARSGVGRLAEGVPEATIVCVRVTGTVDIVRVPKRPRIRVEFFRPAGGGLQPGETATELAVRIMAEIRSEAPVVIPGRRRTATKYRRAVAAAAREDKPEA